MKLVKSLVFSSTNFTSKEVWVQQLSKSESGDTVLGGQGWRLPYPSLRGRELADRRNDRINQFLHEKENSCASSFMYIRTVFLVGTY